MCFLLHFCRVNAAHLIFLNKHNFSVEERVRASKPRLVVAFYRNVC